MKRLLLCSFLILAACAQPDPEPGQPLGLARQISLRAFEQLEPRALAWAELMPSDFEPSFQEFPWNADNPEAMMEATLQSTPLVKALDGEAVKVSGYVVPLDGTAEAISEFLLVPFLGACVHVPPPPANQIVYVKPKYPLLMEESWDVVSVAGTLSAEGRTSDFGAAGYEMVDALLAEFDESEYAGVSQEPVVVDGVDAPAPPPPVDY